MTFYISVCRVYDKDATPVDRSTPLGNPYPMKSENQRDAVCDQYEKWFNEKVKEKDPIVIGELRKLYKLGKKQGFLKLGCHCAPKRCHADTIAKFLKQYT